ncbi:Growth-regulating factor 6 [Zea mays]|uniref:Growth-regulating factor n=1 Tax=Zea mays TaxID=4577 RepID=A0A1D6GT35_MAIZE|nr:Growth-regulating factor 6 [Zea mays]
MVWAHMWIGGAQTGMEGMRGGIWKGRARMEGRRGRRMTVGFAVGYEPYFGKTVYPEPERCRRTDDKKWRCSNEAAPVSKYCERQMHRGHNRSRKHVKK